MVVISMNLVVGDRINLDIRKQGINGEGIGYYNRTLVFVPGAILKESVYCEIVFVTKTYANAKIIEFNRVSKKRVEPPCKFYEQCGGCQMQHIEYKEQLKIKQSILKQSLKKYTKLDVDHMDIGKTVGMEIPYQYRNKSQMPFKNTNFGLALGFYKPESNDFVYVDHCLVHHPEVDKINNEALRILRKHKFKAHDYRNKEGVLLNLVTRYFEKTETASVTFVVSKFKESLKDVAKELLKARASITSISYTISNPKSHLVISDKVHILEGPGWIEDDFRGYKIKVSPSAFHQLNTSQMEKMYDLVLDMLDLDDNSVIFDLYSGIGITTLLFAAHAKKVYGIDYSHASVKDAFENIRINDIENIEFIAKHVESAMPELIASGMTPDLVVMDPPRKGLSRPVIDALLKSAPRQIVYISCNPSTLAKNINDLSKAYDVSSMIPVDMFPNTASVESVTLLNLRHPSTKNFKGKES